MNVKFIRQENVAELYSNIKELHKQVVQLDKSLDEYLGKTNVIENTNIVVEDFSLDMSESNAVLTDFENVKRVYSILKMSH